MILTVDDLTVAYGSVVAVRNLSFGAEEGKIFSLLGPNGAGKTTTLMAIMGMIPIASGAVRLQSRSIAGARTEDTVRAGMTLTPEGRQIFASLTVGENLILGEAGLSGRDGGRWTRKEVLRTFPILSERLNQDAGTLSGGEQQQLAIARSLLQQPQSAALGRAVPWTSTSNRGLDLLPHSTTLRARHYRGSSRTERYALT